jgi:methylmalonyl-CoA mutase
MTTITPEKDVPAMEKTEAAARWRTAVEAELQGAPFEKKLVTKTAEGIAVQPLYFAANAAGVAHLGAMPGEGALARGARVATAAGSAWEFCQEFPEENPVAFNATLTTGLAGGLTAVSLGAGKVGVARDAVYFGAALKGVLLAAIPVHLDAGARVLAAGEGYLAFAKSGGVEADKLSGSVTGDPLAAVALGDLDAKNVSQALDELAVWTARTATDAPRLATIGVSGAQWLEAGGNAVQELAFSLAAGVEYLRALEERGVAASVAAARMRFGYAVGGQFFTEVAKFRAFRLLWARVLKAFELDPVKSWPRVQARTAKWDKSRLDPHVNLLRVTTEALSAVLGGVDSLSIGAFDELCGGPNEISLRIARNVHTVLAEEFRLTSPADPAGGSWYVEKLTEELVRKAWGLFQDVEKQGGYLRALEVGVLAKAIASSAAEKADAVSKRRLGLVGVNLFPNLKERIAAVVENAGVTKAGGAFAPVRAAEGFERLRLASEAYLAKTGARPKVFLAKMGTVKQHKPRADFAAGFFATGGFEAMSKQSFDTAENAALAAVQSAAPVAVLCSTDETYPELAPAFVKAAKAVNPALVVILAGYPTELIEPLKTAGFDDFIHVRSNVRETLEKLLCRIGVMPKNP